MSIESAVNELDKKIEGLVAALANVRLENSKLKEELEQRSNKISEIENENEQLKTEIELLKEDASGQQEKLNITAERIQGLIAKLETVPQ